MKGKWEFFVLFLQPLISLKLFRNENIKTKKAYIVVRIMIAERIYSKLAHMPVRKFGQEAVRERVIKEVKVNWFWKNFLNSLFEQRF